MNRPRHHMQSGGSQTAGGDALVSYRGSQNLREKREHPRANLVTMVDLFQINQSGEKSAELGLETSSKTQAESKDISHGGMFLSGQAPCPVGTELMLSFDLPGVGLTQLPAFVRWHRVDGFGVQFGLLGARETHAIGRLLRASVTD